MDPKKQTIRVNVDRQALHDAPFIYSNYAEIMGSNEEVSIAFYVKNDFSAKTDEDGIISVDAIPLHTVIMSADHVFRFADALHTRLEAMAKAFEAMQAADGQDG